MERPREELREICLEGAGTMESSCPEGPGEGVAGGGVGVR